MFKCGGADIKKREHHDGQTENHAENCTKRQPSNNRKGVPPTSARRKAKTADAHAFGMSEVIEPRTRLPSQLLALTKPLLKQYPLCLLSHVPLLSFFALEPLLDQNFYFYFFCFRHQQARCPLRDPPLHAQDADAFLPGVRARGAGRP